MEKDIPWGYISGTDKEILALQEEANIYRKGENTGGRASNKIPTIAMERRISKILRTILVKQTMAQLEVFQHVSCNPRDTSLETIWFATEIPVTGFRITMMDKYGFVISLINEM